MTPAEHPQENPDSMRSEQRYPEKNLLNAIGGLLRFFGIVTRKNIAKPDYESDRPERPLSVRRERAKLFKLFRRTKNINERHAIIREARDRDDVLAQFLKQGELTIELPGMGTLSSRYTEVNPPPERLIEGAPPVVLIPGISNDLACVDTLAQQLALSGRRVIVIAYPGSFMGTVTPEFAEAVTSSPTFAPHAQYFSQAIRQVLPETSDIELWGFSTGGPIAAEILAHDLELRERTVNAAFINPAGAVEQKGQMIRNTIKEAMGWLSSPSNLPAYVLTGGREKGVAPEPPEQRPLKEKTFSGLLDHVQKPSVDWQKARVRDGGKIVVISCSSDDITQSRKAFNRRTPLPNDQMVPVELPGLHSEPLLHPERVIRNIADAQG